MAAGRKPDYSAFCVTGEGRSANWCRLGAAWTQDDGKGITIQLNALPINNRIVLRDYEPPKDDRDEIPHR